MKTMPTVLRPGVSTRRCSAPGCHHKLPARGSVRARGWAPSFAGFPFDGIRTAQPSPADAQLRNEFISSEADGGKGLPRDANMAQVRAV